MNETIRSLSERSSLRAFSARPVSPEDRRLILTAACMAPTAGNQQLYTILEITDPKLKETLSETCDHQPFIAQAPLVLLFLADCQKWLDAYTAAGCDPRKPGTGDLFLALDDALIAAQNAVTAAESLGIGSCYIGDIMENYEIHRDLLNLPPYVFPAALIVLGWPKEGLHRKKPERFALEHIVHENTYRHMNEAELRKMFKNRAGSKGFDAWIKAFHNRKYNSEFSREMTRSVDAFLNAFHTADQTQSSEMENL